MKQTKKQYVEAWEEHIEILFGLCHSQLPKKVDKNVYDRIVPMAKELREIVNANANLLRKQGDLQ